MDHEQCDCELKYPSEQIIHDSLKDGWAGFSI